MFISGFIERAVNVYKGRLPFFLACLAAFFLYQSPLWADRIYLRDGTVIKGVIIEFGSVYTVQMRDNSKKRVPKYKIQELIFNKSGVERGYDRYYFRFLASLGTAEYTVTAQDKRRAREIPSHPPVRFGAEVGYMSIVYSLGFQGGLEYSHANFYSQDEPSYSYLTLTPGLTYYPHLWDWNVYISPHLRVLLNGSFRFPQEDVGSLSVPIENGGLGYGLHIGYEWHLSDTMIYGWALTYSSDSLKVSKQVAAEQVGRLPGNVEILEDQTSKVNFIGISFTFTYD